MKPLAAVLFLFALAALMLPGASAQNKEDEKKVEKKDGEKKDAAKKDEPKADEKKKDAEKKDEAPKKTSGKAKADPEEEKILTGTFQMRARIQNMDANSAGEFSVQLPFRYPAKLMAAKQWYMQQIQAKNFSQEVINQYQAKIDQSRYLDVRTGSGMKVRTMFPPIEYDSKGNLKRWTTKEIAALRGSSKLPGFPASIENLRGGQIVDLYVAKIPMKKTAPREKKKNIDDDLAEDPLLRPEVLMVVVIQEAPQR
jgi:hypothetical protein